MQFVGLYLRQLFSYGVFFFGYHNTRTLCRVQVNSANVNLAFISMSRNEYMYVVDSCFGVILVMVEAPQLCQWQAVENDQRTPHNTRLLKQRAPLH